MEVYFFKGMKSRGKVEDFSTAGEEHLRREAIQAKKQEFLQSQAFANACDEGIEGLSKDPRGDSSSAVLARGATALFGVASRGGTPFHGGI